MVTGVECAGLVLAVLPLVVELAKGYAKGADSIADVLIQKRRDEELNEFYYDFWWETRELNQRLRQVMDSLPSIPANRKLELIKASSLDDWKAGTDVEIALHGYFLETEDTEAFFAVITKLMKLISRFVDDSTLKLDKTDVDDSNAFRKLQQFMVDRSDNKTLSSLVERFKFRKKEKDRAKVLNLLEVWNKRLGKLIERADKQRTHFPDPNGSTQSRPLSSTCTQSMYERFQKGSQALYTAFSKYWDCCTLRHGAKICLKHFEDEVQDSDILEFDIFISSHDAVTTSVWHESCAIVYSQCLTSTAGCCELQKICDALKYAKDTSRLALVVDKTNGVHRIWRARPQKRKVHVPKDKPAITLNDLMISQSRLTLEHKRRLALIFAYTLLKFHDTAWLQSQWGKGCISFFPTASDAADLERPYLTTSFDGKQTRLTAPGNPGLHPNQSILALGILLIELQTGKPIEAFRDPNDDPMFNTDVDVADRTVENMDTCGEPYREAIKACLDTPWVPAGKRVSLEDSVTRDGLYTHVIYPLERELDYLFPNRRRAGATIT